MQIRGLNGQAMREYHRCVLFHCCVLCVKSRFADLLVVQLMDRAGVQQTQDSPAMGPGRVRAIPHFVGFDTLQKL